MGLGALKGPNASRSPLPRPARLPPQDPRQRRPRDAVKGAPLPSARPADFRPTLRGSRRSGAAALEGPACPARRALLTCGLRSASCSSSLLGRRAHRRLRPGSAAFRAGCSEAAAATQPLRQPAGRARRPRKRGSCGGDQSPRRGGREEGGREAASASSPVSLRPHQPAPALLGGRAPRSARGEPAPGYSPGAAWPEGPGGREGGRGSPRPPSRPLRSRGPGDELEATEGRRDLWRLVPRGSRLFPRSEKRGSQVRNSGLNRRPSHCIGPAPLSGARRAKRGGRVRATPAEGSGSREGASGQGLHCTRGGGTRCLRAEAGGEGSAGGGRV